jgi:hypothetical protein
MAGPVVRLWVEREDTMQYMLMCCIDEELWGTVPEAQKHAIMHEYDELIRSIGQRGSLRASVKLGPSSTGTTVRERNGKTIISDGPFAETKEQLGGYHVVECRDLDEAIGIAVRIPTVRVGGTIEVRPVEATLEG